MYSQKKKLDGVVELSGTELGTMRPLVLGGIIENQNSDFVKPY